MQALTIRQPQEPVRVNVRRAANPLQTLYTKFASADLPTDLDRARRLAQWLDAKFSIGGIRFGIEGIIGLIPFVGDLFGALIGLYPIWVARRHRLGKLVQARMAANLLIEWIGGLLPFVGDAFDIAYKANLRNLRLLEKAVKSRS